MKKSSHKWSLRVFWLLVALLLALSAHFRFWNDERIISWDISLYYSYLPLTFIYQDPGLEKDESVKAWEGLKHFALHEDDEGRKFVKMTCGLAYLYSPSFFLAHLYSLASPHYEANGFSLPYRIGLLLSTSLFALAGLWFLRKLLLRFFKDGAVAITLIATFLGTNLLYYSLKEPMAHAYNFFLASLILYLTFRYFDKKSLLKAFLIGAFSGLLTLIRPTDAIILLFPIILFIKYEGSRWTAHLPNLLIAILAGLLVISPQLFYWHYMAGKWLVYTYTDEGFFFSDPEIWKGLFSYRKGWVIYSPVLVFAGIGFGFLWFKNRLFAIASAVTLFIALWVTFSWWSWWYGGGFGARPMIDFLPLLGFAFAAVFEKLLKAPPLVKFPVLTVAFALCFLSVFYTKQYKSSIIHYDSMSKELFWKQFLIDHFVDNYDQYLDPPDYDAAKLNEDD